MSLTKIFALRLFLRAPVDPTAFTVKGVVDSRRQVSAFFSAAAFSRATLVNACDNAKGICLLSDLSLDLRSFKAAINPQFYCFDNPQKSYLGCLNEFISTIHLCDTIIHGVDEVDFKHEKM